jgi:hypothetical protein
MCHGAEGAQSAFQWVTCWMTEESEFDSWQGKRYSSSVDWPDMPGLTQPPIQAGPGPVPSGGGVRSVITL